MEGDTDDPYMIGTGTGDVLAPKRQPKPGSPAAIHRAKMNEVRLICQPPAEPCFRLPNRDDEDEWHAAVRLASRVRRRVDHLLLLRSLVSTTDFGEEIDAIEGLLLGYHQLLTVDHDGRVTTVVRAIGRYWWGTDPNKPSPRIEHTRLEPAYPAGRLESCSIIENVVRWHLRKADGFPAVPARAIEGALDDLIGNDSPDARKAVRPVVEGIVAEAVAADGELRKSIALGDGWW
jgi:hypothetical protein